MTSESNLAHAIEKGTFIITAEFLPRAAAEFSAVEKAIGALQEGLVAVNVADNPHGPVMSSLAGSMALQRANLEPIYQLVTRDRNRIALQSDLLGAASLGIANVLCLSGYHQALTTSAQAGNAFDIDSIQLVAAIKKMNEAGVLLDGTAIEGKFAMLIGAAANPYLTPLGLSILRVVKKVEAGAHFIQTQPVFDTGVFREWLEAAREEGITEKAALLAGVLPLESAAEAEHLRDTLTDVCIPDEVIARLHAAGDTDAQRREGLAICADVVREIRAMEGLRGIHIFSGGKESLVPALMAAIP
jgi:methylenetetrahydrofolate reductase (NADPH)